MIQHLLFIAIGLLSAWNVSLGFPFHVEQSFGAAPVFTVPQGGTGNGTITAGQLVYGNGTGKFGSAPTTTLTANSPLLLSNPVVKVGGSNSVLTLDTSGSWSGNAVTATALAANGTNCSAGNYPLGVDAQGNAESCTAAGGGGSSFAYPFPGNATSTQITFNGGLVGALTGNASTATALAANGANCSAGSAPRGVDASGAVENCFDVWTEAENTSAAYISDGNTNWDNIYGFTTFAYPFPSNATSTSIAFNGGLTGTLTGSLVGNASTATALAANGANCSAGNYPLGVDASGGVENCTADANTTYTAGEHITLTATDFDVDDDFLLNTGDTGTGNYILSYASTTGFSTSYASTTSLVVSNIRSALHLGGADGTVSAYAGSAPCTNQVALSISVAGVISCTSVSNAMLTNSSVTVNGTPISLGSSGTITAASSTLLADLNKWSAVQNHTAAVGVGTSTPWAMLSISTSTPNVLIGSPLLSIASSSNLTLFSINFAGQIQIAATSTGATSTNMVLDWSRTPQQVEYQIGTGATTITIINATTSQYFGSTKRVWVCNPGSTAGALTWRAGSVEWIGTAPTQTTTANQCDMYFFNVTQATSSALSSTPSYKVAGGANTGFK